MFNKRNQNFDHLIFLNNFAIEFRPFMKYTIADRLPCIHNQHSNNIRNHLH